MKKRTAIGQGGSLIEVENLPNAKILDNQYEKAVTQKVSFLVGQPITFKTDNEKYSELLAQIFLKELGDVLHLFNRLILISLKLLSEAMLRIN